MKEELVWSEILEVSSKFYSAHNGSAMPVQPVWLPLYGRALGLVEIVDFEISSVNLNGSKEQVRDDVAIFFTRLQVEASVKVERYKATREFADHMISLTKSEVSEIQKLLNEARALITDASWIDEEHKTRLLSGLERLQKEVHKTKSDYDVALARLADAGMVVGKFGKDAKPFADLIDRLFGLFRVKSDDPLGLPAPPKQLPSPDEAE